MRTAFSPTLWVSLGAILLGTGAQVWGVSGKNYKCSTAFNVTCPATGICHPPGHCGILAPHKCVNVAPNDTYQNCYILIGQNCNPSNTGCRFEDYNGPGCAAATGVITKPLCYDECF